LNVTGKAAMNSQCYPGKSPSWEDRERGGGNQCRKNRRQAVFFADQKHLKWNFSLKSMKRAKTIFVKRASRKGFSLIIPARDGKLGQLLRKEEIKLTKMQVFIGMEDDFSGREKEGFLYSRASVNQKSLEKKHRRKGIREGGGSYLGKGRKTV